MLRTTLLTGCATREGSCQATHYEYIIACSVVCARGLLQASIGLLQACPAGECDSISAPTYKPDAMLSIMKYATACPALCATAMEVLTPLVQPSIGLLQACPAGDCDSISAPTYKPDAMLSIMKYATACPALCATAMEASPYIHGTTRRLSDFFKLAQQATATA